MLIQKEEKPKRKNKGEIEIIETHGAAAEEDGKVGTCKYRKRRN